MTVLGLEVRRTPLRWALPVLVGVVLMLLLPRTTWAWAWTTASSKPVMTTTFVGPMIAAGAAWAAARADRRGFRAWLDAAARPAWRADLAQLGAAIVIGLTAYAAALALAVFLAARMVGAGFLWPGYALLGVSVIVACSAVGHAFGALTQSRNAAPPIAGALTLFVLMLAQDRYTVGMVLPNEAISRAALASRLLLAAALVAAAAVLPGLRRGLANGYRPGPGTSAVAAVAVAGVLAGSVVTWRQDLLVARDPVTPLCTEGSPQICIWPEQRRFVGELAAMAGRIDGLDVPGLQFPPVVYEEGLHPSMESPGLFLAGGEPWMIADGLADEMMRASLGSRLCIRPGTEDQVVQASSELMYWLALRIAGSPQPANVHGGPDVDRTIIEQVAASSQAEQRRWARQRLDVLDPADCG